MGVLLRHTNTFTTDLVAECCSILMDRLCQPCDESTLPENVFECLRLLMKYPESFNIITTHKKLPFVLKMYLTSPKSEMKIIALRFLTTLFSCSQPNRLIEFLLQVELLDFVYDCLSEEVTVATPAVSLLIALTNSEYFLASNSVAYALEKVLNVKHDIRHSRDFRRLLNVLLEKIFQNYSGSVELFINLSAIENFFANLRCEFADKEVSFLESTRCLLTYLRSGQIYRPFPLQLFTSCLGVYKQRLQNVFRFNITNVSDGFDKFLSNTSTEYNISNEQEGDTGCLLNYSLEIQLHLNNLLFLLNDELIPEKLELEQLIYFNKLLNELYFSLPLDTIWRLFSQKHISNVLIHKLLMLTRKILKKGFRQNALRALNLESTNLPDCFFEERIRRSFVYLLPEIIDVVLKSRNVYQSGSHDDPSLPSEHYSATLQQSGRVEADSPTDPTQFTNNVSQLMVYLIASGLVSFWKTFGYCAAENYLFREYAQFWELVFDGIVFIPGTSVDTLCALLDEVQSLPVDTFSSTAGRMCPALLAVTACLINRHQYLSSEGFATGHTGAALDSEGETVLRLLSYLCAQITCAGVDYFGKLPPIFSVELLASLSIAASFGIALPPVAFQASSILAKALLDRLRDDHTHTLLSLDSFSILLRQADPVWITLAQKMIYHVHANAELVLSGVVKTLPTTYEFLSLVWTVWFTVLGGLEEPHVVDRLSETFTTGFDSLKQSDPEESVGEAKLAGFIAEELSSLSTKWGFPISSVFYKNDHFRRQFLSMLATVTNLSTLFQNRLCLHRTVETLLDLITDEQCDIERDAVPLLSLLSTCLLLSEDPIFPQVSSMVGARLKAAKRPWMIVSSDACNEAAWPAYAKSQKISKLLVEELLCLGAVLILGRSQTDQRVAALEASEEAAVFELSHVLLKAICGLLCATLSRRSFCAAALLLLNSATPGGETKCQSPWPEGTSEAGRVFYTQLITALYSYLTDITLRDLRLLTMALLGKALRIVRHQLPLSEVTKLEGTVWNLVVTESLQLEDYDEDQLPCPPALIVFLAEVGAL
uniref:Uncharacterized protein n=5 Tax=Schistocephalus solidus TaxID=70667 RepID=A0A0X3Q4P9_SCHSO